MFEKGISGNPNGRPKGAKNKATVKIRETLADVVEYEISSLTESLESLEPLERLNILCKLLPFVLPKLANEQLENEAVTFEQHRQIMADNFEKLFENEPEDDL